ncbi:MAG: hypothetical protein JXB32_19910 [Deltaproteobacteria bacterium]|nr:hypothetical protein [Deltaproteobacteria bacterium]
MYLDKKLVFVLLAVNVVLLGGLGWTIWSLQAVAQSAEDAAGRAGEATRRCAPCGAGLTRVALDEALAPVRSDLGATLREARETVDQLAAVRSSLPDLAPLAHFLRFSSAYHELLLERLAVKARVDVPTARAAVEKMFEGSGGGKPAGWFWGAVPDGR